MVKINNVPNVYKIIYAMANAWILTPITNIVVHVIMLVRTHRFAKKENVRIAAMVLLYVMAFA